MPKQEVYHSSTLGPIPLSFTGRRLMQNLREAFQEFVQQSIKTSHRPGEAMLSKDWDAVSLARGKLAQYISQLEQRQNRQKAFYCCATPGLCNHEDQARRMTADEMFQYINSPGKMQYVALPEIPEGYSLTISLYPVEKE